MTDQSAGVQVEPLTADELRALLASPDQLLAPSSARVLATLLHQAECIEDLGRRLNAHALALGALCGVLELAADRTRAMLALLGER